MCASKAFFPCILNVILSSFTWPHVVPHYTLFCLFNEGNCSFDSRWTKKILFDLNLSSKYLILCSTEKI